jgi:hypothetical protein
MSCSVCLPKPKEQRDGHGAQGEGASNWKGKVAKWADQENVLDKTVANKPPSNWRAVKDDLLCDAGPIHLPSLDLGFMAIIWAMGKSCYQILRNI